MNGDGTGRALGVNDPALGWTLFGVFSLVWALWYNGQKDLGDFDVSSLEGGRAGRGSERGSGVFGIVPKQTVKQHGCTKP